ncbi:PhnB protein [Lewinella marina]|uniref:VOC family protein n=1 Tax=Neolewinella marina TaxID=438751 RepID=A0A2G0CAX6_9BACT|nr:VOC family protein [Neolewinella marina]NJB85878.1 PhnB protein [Neolewinella marina]PHK97116.1 VOC family protein [Neolewinella marina]
MASVGTYLNFSNQTEEVFNFYKSVFGGEFVGGISRFGEAPPQEGMPPMSEEDKNLVMNVQLPILGGHLLMGSDSPSSMGMTVNPGNNTHIVLNPDSREETDRLFHALSEGGKVTMELQETFWNAYFGMCTDKYGIQWMVNHDL